MASGRSPRTHTFSSQVALEHLAPSALQSDPNNARIHSQRQLKHLAQSIRAFGFIVPVLIGIDNRVLAGHARLFAAQQLGIKRVPAIRIEHLTPQQARAFQIADNRLAEHASWNDSLLAEQLKALAAVDLDFNIEAIVTLVMKPVWAVGDIWDLGVHSIACGNSLEGAIYAPLMGKDRAAMVFTDPPYNVPIDGFVSGKGKIRHREFAMAAGKMSRKEFREFLGTAFGHVVCYVQDGSLVYICMDWRHLAELLAAVELHFSELKNICVWVKDRAGMGSLYRSQHELIIVAKKGKGRHRNNIELGRNGRHRSNTWNYPSIVSERRGEEGDLLALHPTVKPIRLVADAILDASARGDIVLDPFLGIATTLMACQRVGRVCRGAEIDALYVDAAIRRWQRDTGEAAIHRASGKTFDALSVRRRAR